MADGKEGEHSNELSLITKFSIFPPRQKNAILLFILKGKIMNLLIVTPELGHSFFADPTIIEHRVSDAYSALDAISSKKYDAVLLDEQACPRSFLNTIRVFRLKFTGPIFVLGAAQQQVTKDEILQAGAHAYIGKFQPLAQLKSVMQSLNLGNSKVACGSFCLDGEKRTASYNGKYTNFTPAEFSFLLQLGRGLIVSETSLHTTSGGLTTMAKQLRKKLNHIAQDKVDLIKTVHGKGYVLRGSCGLALALTRASVTARPHAAKPL